MKVLTDTLPAALHAAQRALLHGLDTLGLTERIGGQPAWPFGWRLAVETLALDPALSRQLLLAAGVAALLGLLAALAWWRPRLRPACAVAALVAVAATPWPAPQLLLVAAAPTSFHRSPPGLDVDRVDLGLRLYAAHCAACHGDDGRGETPIAATLPVWPPRLTGGVPWQRPEGELYGHVMGGMRDGSGRPTMPAFSGALRPADAWAVLDAVKVLAGAASLGAENRWAGPLAAPDFDIVCDGRATRLSAWRGRPVRVVADGRVPREDARLETVALAAAGPGCIAPGHAARRVFAALGGDGARQFLVDRDGWLRAMRAGADDWDADDLLCRSAGGVPVQARGLDDLIRRMDADPVRVALGAFHAAPR